MADKWQIDLQRMTASFGNFIVKLRRAEPGTFALEIANAPHLGEEQALTLASEAAQALAHALQQHSRAENEV